MLKRFSLAQALCLVALTSIALSAVGCADDVGVLDRTGLDKVRKAIFATNDEWYYREAITGTDFQNSLGIFEGYNSELKRIRWEITEDALIAYSTVEPSINTAKEFQKPGERRLGVVAWFPIRSHFDIQRGYSTATGQLNNVISEVTSDRPWWEREYMRVNWNANKIDGLGILSATLANYTVRNREISEDELRYDYDRPVITDNYIDTTTEYYVEPERISCLSLGLDAIYNCEAGTTRLRHSFLKVPKKQTYQPFKYNSQDYFWDNESGRRVLKYSDGETNLDIKCDFDLVQKRTKDASVTTVGECSPLIYPMDDRFGYFRTERSVYTPRRYGWEAQRLHLANRWNIWQTAYNEDGSIIPLNERQPKQIVYYTNAGFPEEYWPVVERITHAWNKVFTDVVKNARYVNTCDGAGIQAYYDQYIATRDKAVNVALLTRAYEPGTQTEVSEVLEAYAGTSSDQLFSYEDDAVLRKLLDAAESALEKRKSEDEALQQQGGLTGNRVKSICEAINGIYGSTSNVKKVSEETAKKGGITIAWANELSCNNAEPSGIIKWLKDYFKNKAEVRTKFVKKQIEEHKKSKNSGAYLNPNGLDNRLLPDKFWFDSTDFIQDMVNMLAREAIDSYDISELQGLCKGNLESLKQSSTVKETLNVPSAFQETVKAIWNKLNVTFDDNELSGIKKLIAESNGGDDHMFVIRRNTCSPKGIKDWFDNHSDLNYQAEEIRDRLSKGGSIEANVEALPLETLKRTCAEIEYVTAKEEKEENRFTWQRFGDLRYSFFNYVKTSVPWLGYGPSAADPVTGEIISASANFAGNGIARSGATAADLIFMGIGGDDYFEKEMIWGDYVNNVVRKQTELASAIKNQKRGFLDLSDSKKSLTPPVPGLTLASLDRGPADYTKFEGFTAELLNKLSKNEKATIDAMRTKKRIYLEKVQSILDDPVVKERMLSSQELSKLYEMYRSQLLTKFKGSLDDKKIDDLAYQTVINPMLIEERRKEKRRLAAEQNMLMFDDVELSITSIPSYVGAVKYFEDMKNDNSGVLDRSVVEKYFRDVILYSTQLHEFGHTFGLRHNFGGSTDAVNYHKEYWDLMIKVKETEEFRKNNKTEFDSWNPKKRWENGFVLEDDLNYLPKQVAEKLLGYKIDQPYFNQALYREAAIMDYTPSFLGGAAGIGSYENAAIQFAYANKVEQLPASAKIDRSLVFYSKFKILDYRDFPKMFIGVYAPNANITAAEYAVGVKNMVRNRGYVDIEDSKAEMLEGLKDNLAIASKTNDLQFRNVAYLDKTAPYFYCTDQFAGGMMFCDLFDYGANQREIINYRIDEWRAMKNYRRYLRGRTAALGQNFTGYARYLMNTLESLQQTFYLFTRFQYYNLGNFSDNLKAASLDVINFMGEVFAQPEPGVYCLASNEDEIRRQVWEFRKDAYVPKQYYSGSGNCSIRKTIGLNEGAFYFNDYVDGSESRVQRVGSFIDKQYAVLLFFNISGYFVYNDQINDIRASNVSFWSEFRKQVYQWTRALVLGDFTNFGGVMTNTGYQPPLLVDPASYDNSNSHAQSGLPRVYTPFSFNDQYLAILFSIIANTTDLDAEPDSIQFMKICSSPSECQMSTENYENGFLYENNRIKPVVFIHPTMPIEFRAFYTVKDGKAVDTIATELLKKLNNLKEKYLKATSKKAMDFYANRIEDYISYINIIRYTMRRTQKPY